MLNMNESSGTVRSADRRSHSENDKNKKKHDIIPKILCLVAAFVLWIYVMQTESPEYEGEITSVSVEIENLEDLRVSGLSVYNRSANTVSVKLTGKKSVISNLDKEQLNAFVDVGTIKESGNHLLNVTFVDLPEGVNVVKSEPSSISVYVDETDTISLPVKEKLENFELETSYELGEIGFDYDSITVTGPKKKLNQISSAVARINMNDRASSFTTKCSVELIDKYGKKVDMSYLITSLSEVNATVPIFVTKEIPVETVFKHGYLNDEMATVTVEPTTITVKGDVSKLSDINSVIDPIVIDEKLITENDYSVVMRVQADSELIVAEEDQEINVTVTLDKSVQSKKYAVDTVEIKGAPDGLDYEILSTDFTVTLKGSAEALAEITSADIKLVVDLEGYDSNGMGTITKTATVVIDSDYSSQVYDVDTYKVQIKIN